MSPGAAQRDPEADRAVLRAIRDAAQSGDIERAASMAAKALSDGLEHPMALNLAALKLENEGRIEEAVARLRRAVELAPRDIGARNALGLCLNRMEAPEEALEHFDAVLAVDPSFAPAHYNRGSAFDALGQLDKAESDYRRVLDLMPDNAAAMSGLASIRSRRGAYGDARAMAEQAVARIPDLPEAVMTLAAADLGEGDAVGSEERLRALLADPRPAPLERALAKGMLGDALDAQDRIAEAFEAYREGNDERRRLYANRFESRPGALETVRWMTERLERAPDRAPQNRGRPILTSEGRSAPARIGGAHLAGGVQKERAWRPTVHGHVFLLGFPRSGTTLLEQALASHPGVETLEERELLIDSVREFLRTPADLGRLLAASEADLGPFRDLYWRRVVQAGVRIEGKVFVDKHPLNTLKLPVIGRLFPEARVIFARRDPRDVVLSCFRRRFRMSAPYYQMLTLGGAAELYDAAMRFAECAIDAGCVGAHIVRHEDVVADFDAEAKAICAFVGLDWTESMRDFAARTRDRSISTPSAAQLARGLNAGGMGQWRRYRVQMASVLPILEPWVERFSYGGEP
jgi:tetratricopeptide (TPR) repeat protein